MPPPSPAEPAVVPEGGRAFTAHLHVSVDVGAILAVVLLPPTLLALAAVIAAIGAQ